MSQNQGSVAFGSPQAPSAANPAPVLAPAPGAVVPAPPPAPGTASQSDAAARSAAGTSAGGTGPARLDLGVTPGRIERTVNARYVVPHGGFLDAFSAVVNHATALGGFVVESSTTPDAAGRISSGQVTVKVPAARLSDLIGGLPSDFTVSSLNYGSQDHTAESVDLNARVAAAIAHRAALERLRDRAGSIADIANLEQQIAQVQLEVDQDQGNLNAVNARVDLATATIALSEKDARPVPPPVHPTDNTLLSALRTGAGNALQIVAGGLLAGVTVLPIAVLVLAAWLGRRRLRRLFNLGQPSA
jgi:hypothetical protein